ncbi:MAG: ornithine cyclodeaminase [Rhodospirillaceae bacterium]|nr:ornithine cyclodeaminase [Rhodospirillaceae bacterium]|tara:strand:+ start:6713 stop:7678 length:966 start_codon:yes stop_codon:yes gene_type:complete
MTDESLLYLRRQDVRSLGITTANIIGMIESLLSQGAEGRAWNTPKAQILPGDAKLHMSMLATASEPPLMAVKSLGMNPANPQQGLETIGALITVFDSESGLPLGIMDADWITGVRTAGLSATAAHHLGRKDAETLAFLGCGLQARCHLEAFSQIFPLKRIRALGRGAANRDKLVALAREMGLEAEGCTEPEDAIRGADLIVSSVPHTTLKESFVSADLMSSGSFTAMTDLTRPWHADSIARMDRIFIDDAEQERSMADPMVPQNLITGDLTDLATGAQPDRLNDEERTVFAFRGLAMGDLALAALCYTKAVEQGVGQRLDR